jgi:predicted Rdx family selenoprotein
VRDALQRKGVSEIDLQTGKSGQFDVIVDGTLKYSRYQTGRFPSDADINALV